MLILKHVKTFSLNVVLLLHSFMSPTENKFHYLPRGWPGTWFPDLQFQSRLREKQIYTMHIVNRGVVGGGGYRG